MRIADGEQARFEDAIIPAAAAGSGHGAGDFGGAVDGGKGAARLADLRHLQQCRAAADDVADAQARFVLARDAEVLAHGAGDELGGQRRKLRLPAGIARDGVAIDGLFGAAVDALVDLNIAFEAQFADRNGAGDRQLAVARHHAVAQ